MIDDPQQPAHPSDAPPSDSIRKKLLEGKIIETIRTVYDPEIPVNIYELGLIYKIDIDDNNGVDIRMTLTAPGCPVAGSLVEEVQTKVQAIEEVSRADVELVWDPPWGKEMMSEAAMLDLGLM
jgi:FeS assembly SUF system protein